MKKLAVAVSRAELLNVYSEHRLIRGLLGRLEHADDEQVRFDLLVELDDAFYSHSEVELEILKKTAPDDPNSFVKADQRQHFATADLLLQLRDLRLSNEMFRVKASLLHKYMSEHMAVEEHYLRSRMDPPLQRKPHALAFPT